MDFLSKRETNEFCARMVLTQSANDDWLLQCKIQFLLSMTIGTSSTLSSSTRFRANFLLLLAALFDFFHGAFFFFSRQNDGFIRAGG